MKTQCKLLILLIASTALSACATRLTVQVDAIADPTDKPQGMHYVWVNQNPGGHNEDLFFKEFRAYFAPLLAAKGYQAVEKRADAQIEIRFQYGVSEGRTSFYTFTRPIYAITGGETVTYTETKTDTSGTTTTKGTVSIPIHHQYVGTVLESQSVTEFTSTAVLEAYRLEQATGQAAKDGVLWKTMISSTSSSNDLRAIMPALATAAAPYLAGNSGTQQTVRLKWDDPQIQQIRQQAQP